MNIQAMMDDEGPGPSYGIVYPDLGLSMIENPAVMSVQKKDRLTAYGGVPITASIPPKIIRENQHPFWVSYTTNPEPFGIGIGSIVENDGLFFVSGSCGIEKIQLGATSEIDPHSQSVANTFTARIGALAKSALAVSWGDTQKTIGLGFVIEKLVLEVDASSDLTFAKVPYYIGTIGYKSQGFGANIGANSVEIMPKTQTTPLNRFYAGLYTKPSEHFTLTLYYRKWFSTFSIAATYIFH